MEYRGQPLENRMVLDSEWPEQEKPHSVRCSRCGEELRICDDPYDSDDVFYMDGLFYCEDCLTDTAKELFRFEPE